MEKTCVIHRIANFIGKKWTLLILLELYKGENKWRRFSELKRRLNGITSKILSQRLKELVKEGIIVKRVCAKNFPICSEYSLTENGNDFIKVIKYMKQWALKYELVGNLCNKKTHNCNCKKCEL